MKIVGTNHSGYANDRNIAQLPWQRYRVVRGRNSYRVANFLHFKLRREMHAYYPYLHWDGGFGNYDLLHLFNGISLGKKPWLSTFETYLPRWAAYGGKRIEWGLEKLAGVACKRLIALSQCTANIQAQFLQDYPAFAANINSKVAVLHPPQATLMSAAELESKSEHNRDAIRFIFVGADFFRKGGLETLRAFDILLQQGANIELEIVSAMHLGDYASQATQIHLDEAWAIIKRYPDQISHYKSLPNALVLDHCRKADIGLLPTWADTYGYSALEFMAAGCPVVSTDIRALPEINSQETGWVIPTRKDDWQNAILKTAVDREAFSDQLKKNLLATLEGILGNPKEIITKGRAAYASIVKNHAPESNVRILERWYDEALT